MQIYVVYRYPADYPNKFVVRRWELVQGRKIATSFVQTADSLEEIRKCVPPKMSAVSRSYSDDPAIVECWL